MKSYGLIGGLILFVDYVMMSDVKIWDKDKI